MTFSSFTANWSSVSGATDYRLDVSTSNSFTTYVPGYQDLNVGNMTSYPVTGLNAKTTYYYRVRAYNGCATSPNSSAKNVKTMACTPAAPSAQSATNVTPSSFTANWRSVSGAIDYRLDVSTSNTFTTYVPGYQDLSVGNVTSFFRDRVKCADDLLLPSASLQWVCYERQFQRHKCNVALRSEGERRVWIEQACAANGR